MREDTTDHRSIQETEEEFPQFTQPNYHVEVVSVTDWWTRPSADEFEELEVGAVGQCSQEHFNRCVFGGRKVEFKVQDQMG